MSISAYTLDHPSVNHLRHRPGGLAELGTVDMYCLVTPDTATLDFVGPHYRPVLRLKGMVSGMEVAENHREAAAMYGIESIDFDTGEKYDGRPRMTCDYTFDEEQIKRLVDKGLYDPDFAPPRDLFTTEQWLIPAKVDLQVSQPEHEGEPAVLLCDVQNVRALPMSRASSGYDLVEYFPDLIADKQYGAQYEGQYQRADRVAGRDMFADVTFEEERTKTPAQRQIEHEAEIEGLRPHEKLPGLAGEKSLEFTEAYTQEYPSEDYIVPEVTAEREKLEAMLAESEGDQVRERFEQLKAQTEAAMAAERVGLGEDFRVDEELETEDFGDLFAEDSEPEADTPAAEREQSQDEMVVGTTTEPIDLTEQVETDQRSAGATNEQAPPKVSGQGDMFAEDDLEDEVVADTPDLEGEEYDKEEQRLRRQRARQSRQSRRAAESQIQAAQVQAETEPSTTAPVKDEESFVPRTMSPKEKGAGPELG